MNYMLVLDTSAMCL